MPLPGYPMPGGMPGMGGGMGSPMMGPMMGPMGPGQAPAPGSDIPLPPSMPEGLGDVMGLLAMRMRPKVAKDLMSEAIEKMRQARDIDPKIASRVSAALAVIRGQSDSDKELEANQNEKPYMGQSPRSR